MEDIEAHFGGTRYFFDEGDICDRATSSVPYRDSGFFTETTAYAPRFLYYAFKASSDHPVTLSNCSNNCDPFQFPEKILPLMIINIREGVHFPSMSRTTTTPYGLSRETDTPAKARENIWIVNTLRELIAQEMCRKPEEYKGLITYAKDRLGHDRRYAIACSKIKVSYP